MGVSTTHRISLSMWILIYSFSDTYHVWAACGCFCLQLHSQASVVQKLDSAIHRINLYPVNSSTIIFPNTNPLDSDSVYPVGSAIQRLNNWGQNRKPNIEIVVLNRLNRSFGKGIMTMCFP